MTENNNVLSPGDAMALGDLLTGITGNRKVRWVAEQDEHTIHTGEFRSLVQGDGDFSMLKWGTDVRDAYVWITASPCEYTVSVRRLITLLQEGGCVIE